jgi:fibronectin type 3 domain-containing protein
VSVSARLFVEGTTTAPPVFQSRLTIPWHETAVPAAVATLNAVDHPSDQGDGIDLTWSADTTDGDLAGYTLYRSTTSGGSYTRVTPFPVSGTAYTDRSLTPGVTYYYVVRAYDTSGNESPNSPQASATAIDNLAPPAVINFTAGDGADGQSPLAWTNPVDPALAEVLVLRKTGSYPTGHTDPTAVTAYQSTSPVSGAPVAVTNFGLTNGTTYYYAVYSRDAAGNWNDTTVSGGNADSAEPSNVAPLAPTGLLASDRSSDEGGFVVLTWTPSTAPGILEQRIYRSTTSGGPYSLAQTITGNTTQTAIDAGLTNGVAYSYVIRAYNGTRESGDSTQASATPFDNLAPAAPSGLIATDTPDDQGGSVTLAWAPAPSADIIQQRVYRGTTAGGPYTLIQTIADRSTNTFTDTTVTNGTTYFYIITAFDATQEGAASNEANTVPSDNLVPPAPLDLSAIDHPADNGQALDLSWTPSTTSDVIEQRIYRSVAVGGPYLLVATITDNTTSAQTDTGLTNGTTYFYVVRAFDGTQESLDSAIASAIPSDNLLTNPPTGLSATDVPADRGGAIALTWTPSTSTDVTEQRVYRSTTTGGPYTLAATVAGTATGYTDTPLTNGTTYFYVVRAFDGAQEGLSSNQAAAAPADNSVFHLHSEFSTVTGGP